MKHPLATQKKKKQTKSKKTNPLETLRFSRIAKERSLRGRGKKDWSWFLQVE